MSLAASEVVLNNNAGCPGSIVRVSAGSDNTIVIPRASRNGASQLRRGEGLPVSRLCREAQNPLNTAVQHKGEAE